MDCLFSLSRPKLEPSARTGRARVLGERFVRLAIVFSVSLTSCSRDRAGDRDGGQLTVIGNALIRYQEFHGQFPPAVVLDGGDRPLHSWRVLLLPFVEANGFINEYDFRVAWNDGSNKDLVSGDRFHEGAKFPSPAEVRRVYRASGSPTKHETDFFLVSRESWRTIEFRRLTNTPRSLPAIDVTSSDEVLLVEIRDSNVHWMAPCDVFLGDVPPGNWMDYDDVRERIVQAVLVSDKLTYLNRDEAVALLEKINRQ